MIYLTSDPHFGHANIIRYVDRPFGSVEEMDKVLIDNFNKTVAPDDTLYILGDFSMHGDYEKVMHYRQQLNCNHIHLVCGNHDRRFFAGYFETGKSAPFESERDYLELTHKCTKICMSHYPFLSWNGREQESIMCHGHLHSKKRSNEINQWQQIRRFDVGVDANDYTPVSLDYILDFFSKPLEEIFN